MASIGTDQSVPSRYSRTVLVLLALAIVALSFYGGMDQFAREYVAETMKESVGIYALARIVNAAVSVLQASQANVVVASISVGEVLDPINDAIERLSSGMVWAIGSLFVQRIMLEAVSHIFFKWFLLVSGVAAVLALFSRGRAQLLGPVFGILGISPQAIEFLRNMLVRIFIFAVLLRFIVPVFVSVSFLASQIFLQPEIESNMQQLSTLEEQVSASKVTLPSPQDLGRAQLEKMSELKDLKGARSGKQAQLDEVKARIGELNEEAGLQRFVPRMLGGESPDDAIGPLQEERDALEAEIEALDNRIATAQDDLECIEMQLVGESCESWLGKIASAGKKSVERMSAIADAADRSVMAVALILVAVLVKNLLFPVMFLIVVVKLAMPIVRSACRVTASARGELEEAARATNQVERAPERP